MVMVSATENISPALGDHLQFNQGNHGHGQDHHLHKNPEVKVDLNGNSSTHHGHDHDHNLHENSELKSDLNGNSSTHDGYDHDHHLHENPEMKCEINENNSKEFSIKKNGKKAKEVKIVKRKKPTTKDQVVVSWACADCKTSQTPLWRTGPAGPRSLCNACGIKLRKKRKREAALLEKERNASIKKKQKQVEEEERELQKKYAGKEEVQAARLLMALSCGIWV